MARVLSTKWGCSCSCHPAKPLLSGNIQAVLSTVSTVPIFGFQEIILSPFVCATTTSSEKPGESFIPGIPLRRVLLGHHDTPRNAALVCNTNGHGPLGSRGLIMTKTCPHRSLPLFIFLKVSSSGCSEDLGLGYCKAAFLDCLTSQVLYSAAFAPCSLSICRDKREKNPEALAAVQEHRRKPAKQTTEKRTTRNKLKRSCLRIPRS